MLRKCAAVLAVSLLCLSGQANAQQATSKATASTVQRVGVKPGPSNNATPKGAGSWQGFPAIMSDPQVVTFTVFGAVGAGVMIYAQKQKHDPSSP